VFFNAGFPKVSDQILLLPWVPISKTQTLAWCDEPRLLDEGGKLKAGNIFLFVNLMFYRLFTLELYETVQKLSDQIKNRSRVKGNGLSSWIERMRNPEHFDRKLEYQIPVGLPLGCP
jgi:hypothetical protein